MMLEVGAALQEQILVVAVLGHFTVEYLLLIAFILGSTNGDLLNSEMLECKHQCMLKSLKMVSLILFCVPLSSPRLWLIF